MKAKEFRKLVNEVIDEELTEMSSTASAGGEYNIPAAFEKKKKKPVDESRKYEAFKNDPTKTQRKKIGDSVREILTQLREIDAVLGMTTKLKNDNAKNPESPIYKRTVRQLGKMENLILAVAYKIRELKA